MQTPEIVDENKIIENGPKFGKRHIQTVLLFFCTCLNYWVRSSVSVAIVTMTDPTATHEDAQTFNWNEQQKSVILSSYFWSHSLGTVPGSYLSQYFGTRKVLLISMLIPAVLDLITPVSVLYGGLPVFCAIRAAQGAFGGASSPAIHSHISKWAPRAERNRLGGFTYSGLFFGIFFAYFSSGMISTTILGWSGIFYTTGILGILWSITWFLYSANSPGECKSITNAEKQIMELSEISNNHKTYSIPWKYILTSAPVWALIFANISCHWAASTMITQLPTYFNYVLEVNIETNAILSALPFGLMIIWFYICLGISDTLQRRNIISLNVLRKVANSLAEWGQGICLLIIAFMPKENVILIEITFIISQCLASITILGQGLNHIDLSPNYAGALVAVTNTCGTLMNIIVPLVVGAVVTDETDVFQWRIVFFMCTGINFIGNIIFLLFGKTDKQKWNDPDYLKRG